jgi:hypothetical protein
MWDVNCQAANHHRRSSEGTRKWLGMHGSRRQTDIRGHNLPPYTENPSEKRGSDPRKPAAFQ